MSDETKLDEIKLIRPFKMAIPSFNLMVAYCLGCWLYLAFTGNDIFNFDLALLLGSPCLAFIGLREFGKGIDTWANKQKQGG